jgi:Fe2+ transport system protein FeoA
MSLAHAPIRKTLRITGVRRGGLLSQRLMEMGLIEGAEVEVVRRAPLGDPLHVRLGDSELSLRTSEARLVDVSSV